MPKHPDVVPPEHIACQVCLKEIPRSAAQSQEGAEYVYYFCGDKCYQQWQERERKPGEPENE